MMTLSGQNILFKRIINDLADNVTTLVLLPDLVDWRKIEYLLEEALIDKAEHLLGRSLVLVDCEEQSPVVNLSEALAINWVDKNAPRTVQNLIKNGGMPEIILLRTFMDATLEHQANWVRCLFDFNEIRLKNRVECPAFCVVARAMDKAVTSLASGPGFSTYYWYDFCSLAEAESFYQQEMEGRNLAETVWKASLLASLAGEKYGLAENLDDVILKGVSPVLERLTDIAREFGWEDEDLRRQGIEQFLNRHCYISLDKLKLDNNIRQLWALGLMDFSREFGWEISSWVLGALGLRKELKHRIWRAQVKVVMPIINQLRLRIIQTLVRGYGSEWLAWDIPLTKKDNGCNKSYDPFDAELFFLWNILRSHKKELRKEQIFLPSLRQAHLLRNKLAHYETIEFAEYQDLLRRLNDLMTVA